MARLLLHEYLAGGVWANLHKASFVLSFVKCFKIIEGNHHGLSHVISHGLGHDVFKRVSWVEPGKNSWVRP